MPHGQYRVMFLCKVAVGATPYKTQEGYIAPDDVAQIVQQHTAIVGEVGQNLNYEEVVVYNNAVTKPHCVRALI